MKRILHVIPGYGGGISSHIKNLVTGIDNNIITIDVAGFTDYPKEFKELVESKNGKTYVLKNVRIKSIFNNIKEFKLIISEGNYDAVHLHLSDFQALYFSMLSRINGVKRIIVHAHISNQRGSDKIINKVKNFINRKITVFSATDLASCSKLASEFRFGKKFVINNKVMHIPNGICENKLNIELSESKRIEYYNEFKIDKDSFIIGNVGYLGYQKNHEFMLKLAEYMKNRGDKCCWLFIGSGIDEKKLKRKCSEMKLDDVVRFLGRREDIAYIYNIMDVSILPSHYEGLPTVTIESQAVGIGSVISDSITDETDMGINMVSRLSLNDSYECWRNALYDMKNRKSPDSKTRFNAMRKMKFTTDTMASLYEQFILGKINYYNIGEETNE